MGFTAGFYRARKHNNLPLDEVEKICHTVQYDISTWTKEHYTYDEFMKSEPFFQNPEEDYNKWRENNKENIDWYANNMYYDEEFDENKTFGTFGWWCSGGAKYHDFFIECASECYNDDGTWVYDKAGISKALEYFLQKLTDNFKYYTIENSFKYKQNPEDEDDVDYIVSRCDGIEVCDDDNNIRRVDVEYDYVIVPKLDECEFNTLINIIETLNKILSEVDFDEEFVTYNGGW